MNNRNKENITIIALMLLLIIVPSAIVGYFELGTIRQYIQAIAEPLTIHFYLWTKKDTAYAIFLAPFIITGWIIAYKSYFNHRGLALRA